ncbi:MAG: heparan-alpha-glucosaminide N-acetyltransferase domain-containing protein [Caldilineales bacterium]
MASASSPTWRWDRPLRPLSGILQLIGTSIIIAYPLLRFRWLNLLLGILVIAPAPLVASLWLDLPWLQWLGPTPAAGWTDAPLIPWFGRVLIGIFLGNTFYRGGQRRFSLPDFANNGPMRFLRIAVKTRC